jgi:hypothetical protein
MAEHTRHSRTGRSPVTISSYIQEQLRVRKLTYVDPVTATQWLIEAGLQDKLGSRPGSYLRTLCRKGLIVGATKTGSRWRIERKAKPT